MTTLYRLFDGRGELLYIGIADHWTSRLRQHASDKPWLVDVARVELVEYEGRQAAVDAERQAIADEQPFHNIIHNGRSQMSTKSYWRCEVCREPIGEGEGYLACVRSAGETWHCYHRACDPLPNKADVEHLIADELLVGYWVRYLRGKRWFDEDEWNDLVRRCLIGTQFI